MTTGIQWTDESLGAELQEHPVYDFLAEAAPGCLEPFFEVAVAFRAVARLASRNDVVRFSFAAAAYGDDVIVGRGNGRAVSTTPFEDLKQDFTTFQGNRIDTPPPMCAAMATTLAKVIALCVVTALVSAPARLAFATVESSLRQPCLATTAPTRTKQGHGLPLGNRRPGRCAGAATSSAHIAEAIDPGTVDRERIASLFQSASGTPLHPFIVLVGGIG